MSAALPLAALLFGGVAAAPARAVVGGGPVGATSAVARILVTETNTDLDGTGSPPQVCTGALVAARWVVTAAHCLFGIDGTPATSASIRVDLGADTADGTRARGGEQRTAVAAYLVAQHPTGADVALLRLNRPSTATPLPVAHDLPRPGTRLRLLGWGVTGTGSDAAYPDTLRGGTVRLLTASDCPTAGDGYFCVDAVNAAACYGDSGGPVLTGPAEHPALLGAVSRADPATTTDPDGVTRCGTRELISNLTPVGALLTELRAQNQAQGQNQDARTVTSAGRTGKTTTMLVPLPALARLGIRVENLTDPGIGTRLITALRPAPIAPAPATTRSAVSQAAPSRAAAPQAAPPRVAAPQTAPPATTTSAPTRPARSLLGLLGLLAVVGTRAVLRRSGLIGPCARNRPRASSSSGEATSASM